MIDLKDVVALWLKCNKNRARSWVIEPDPDDTWILKPINPKLYKTKSRGIIFSDTMKLHYDDDGINPPERGCNTVIVLAGDPQFFQRLAEWMHFVRRR